MSEVIVKVAQRQRDVPPHYVVYETSAGLRIKAFGDLSKGIEMPAGSKLVEYGAQPIVEHEEYAVAVFEEQR